MHRLHFVFLCALVALVISTPSLGSASFASANSLNAITLPDRYILPGDAVFPEGIAYQRGTGAFYVSSTADGTIFAGTLANPNAQVFLPGGQDGRTAAVGLAVDRQNRLFVAGGATGKLFVYDTNSGDLRAAFANNLDATFVNDVVVAPTGDAYATDSLAPVLYRVSTAANGDLTFETWLDFRGTPFEYRPGFNANGIAASANGRYLIVVQSNTGKLYRIAIPTKTVTEIDLGGATVTNGDGLLLLGRMLYVVRNRQELIVNILLSNDFTQGDVLASATDQSFAFPTTIDRALDQLLVVNAQFDRRGSGLTPDLPFTVSRIPIPLGR
ncbi:MAG: SMP-30/gluconolactonase/LRE family protein [Chloroflexales bacterium]|nr:SMP-30/gluconolactonase/LRE family protein [Chloroflexales bacterium]